MGKRRQVDVVRKILSEQAARVFVCAAAKDAAGHSSRLAFSVASVKRPEADGAATATKNGGSRHQTLAIPTNPAA